MPYDHKLPRPLLVHDFRFDLYLTEEGHFKVNLSRIVGGRSESWVSCDTLAGLREKVEKATRDLAREVHIPATLPSGNGQLLHGQLVGFAPSGAVLFRPDDGRGAVNLDRQVTVYRRLTDEECARLSTLDDLWLQAEENLRRFREGLRIDHVAVVKAAVEESR